MIVCSCNMVTDHDVRATLSAREDIPRTTRQVYQYLGCNAQCGRCVPTIRRIMDEALATTPVTHDLFSQAARQASVTTVAVTR
jgi:bacterioferritin-associated ferredoxin